MNQQIENLKAEYLHHAKIAKDALNVYAEADAAKGAADKALRTVLLDASEYKGKVVKSLGRSRGIYVTDCVICPITLKIDSLRGLILKQGGDAGQIVASIFVNNITSIEDYAGRLPS